MKIYFEVEECKNEELLEKMKNVNYFGEFRALADEYGWDECVDAFAAVNEWFDIDKAEEWLLDEFYGYDNGGGMYCRKDTILHYLFQIAVKDKKEYSEAC